MLRRTKMAASNIGMMDGAYFVGRNEITRTPPQLVDDAIHEILLRLPPDDPASLARASAVCRAWRRILAEPNFNYRYRAFHRTPPVLGFFCEDEDFFPTTSFRPPAADHQDCHVLDCRHGRVLLKNDCSGELVVWDPITGDQHRLPEASDISFYGCYGAVLCASDTDCDHLDCHGGAFVVVFLVGNRITRQMHAGLYSSKTGAWSAQTSIQLDDIPLDTLATTCLTVDIVPAALVGDALYFIGDFSNVVLRYDLVRPSLSIIQPPDVEIFYDGVVVMPEEDGGLGFAVLRGFTLHLWSMETGPNGDTRWANHRVIDVEILLPIDDLSYPPISICFVDGANVIAVTTSSHAIFTIELKSLRATKVCETDKSYCRFLYSCFCTPACASGRLPSPVTSGD